MEGIGIALIFVSITLIVVVLIFMVKTHRKQDYLDSVEEALMDSQDRIKSLEIGLKAVEERDVEALMVRSVGRKVSSGLDDSVISRDKSEETIDGSGFTSGLPLSNEMKETFDYVDKAIHSEKMQKRVYFSDRIKEACSGGTTLRDTEGLAPWESREPLTGPTDSLKKEAATSDLFNKFGKLSYESRKERIDYLISIANNHPLTHSPSESIEFELYIKEGFVLIGNENEFVIPKHVEDVFKNAMSSLRLSDAQMGEKLGYSNWDKPDPLKVEIDKLKMEEKYNTEPSFCLSDVQDSWDEEVMELCSKIITIWVPRLDSCLKKKNLNELHKSNRQMNLEFKEYMAKAYSRKQKRNEKNN